jgi:hypothetical protein
MKNILCVKWGDKYDNYVEKLKLQVEKHCSYDFKFYCLTDKPERDYDLQLPTHWDEYYIPEKNTFWAYRKCYMFNEDLFPELDGDEFLFLDLDILIHQSIDCLFDLDMEHPWIVRGWWNDIENCRKNYGKLKSTPLNSSIIRWNRGQLQKVYDHIETHKDVIFFSYRTIDNYFNHFWYNPFDENDSYFTGFKSGITYSWYKGNIFPDDMEINKLRKDHVICLFNNSSAGIDEHMDEIEEQKDLW